MLEFSGLRNVMFVMGKINWGLKSFVHLGALVAPWGQIFPVMRYNHKWEVLWPALTTPSTYVHFINSFKIHEQKCNLKWKDVLVEKNTIFQKIWFRKITFMYISKIAKLSCGGIQFSMALSWLIRALINWNAQFKGEIFWVSFLLN